MVAEFVDEELAPGTTAPEIRFVMLATGPVQSTAWSSHARRDNPTSLHELEVAANEQLAHGSWHSMIGAVRLPTTRAGYENWRIPTTSISFTAREQDGLLEFHAGVATATGPKVLPVLNPLLTEPRVCADLFVRLKQLAYDPPTGLVAVTYAPDSTQFCAWTEVWQAFELRLAP